MVENLINLKKINKKLGVSLNKQDSSIFKKIKPGLYSSLDIPFLFDNNACNTSIHSILTTEEIIEATSNYNLKCKTDNIPIIDENSFIFAYDIGYDVFIFNTNTSSIYYSGEVTFYEQVLLHVNLTDIINSLVKIEEEDTFIFKFTDSEIDSLNPQKNLHLYNFLSKIQYGIVDIDFKYNYNENEVKDKISFIYGFNYLKTINNDNNIFIFGTTKNNKELAFDLINNNILLIINENYIPLDINLSLIRE